MTIREDAVEDFLRIFRKNGNKIRNFPGCHGLRLQREIDTTVFFTYSLWDSDEALQAYRQSDLFAVVWPALKSCFGNQAKAWSTEVIEHLP